MGENELPTFIALIAVTFIFIGVIVAIAAVTWAFLLI